ncbi:MAG: cyclopropane-fatty-acyl-phospholipid synthase family protein [Pseudomonadota bacterium]
MTTAMNYAIDLSERGMIPDPILRKSIRHLVQQRLKELNTQDCENGAEISNEFVAMMNVAPIAPVPEKANEQHYEVPTDLFRYTLGQHMKYSSCYWQENVEQLDQAEEDSLRLTCEHAMLEDGLDILELGCGWGSLSLWMAGQYPNSNITSVSNSNSQREYILQQASEREIANLEVITVDMNDFQIDKTFDRVVSVEMFEHMRNYKKLYKMIAGLLNPNGKFFKHIFVHRAVPYEFIIRDETDWMSRYFFSGGIMPSDELPLFFQDDLSLKSRWRWDGTHYEKTSNAWLRNMDNNRDKLMPILADTYGKDNAMKWWMRWRMFYMSCAELFGFENGQQWWVSHYLFEKR